jgi:hypothetical protein
MRRDPLEEERRLEALIGRWRTEGSTIGAPGGGAEIRATDTYEWLPGRYGLLHRVDARVGEETVVGAEIIGWDAERGTYVTQYFGSDGPAAFEASLGEEEGRIVWAMQTATERFRGTFSDDGERIEGRWERRDEGSWQPWMEIALTREVGDG